MNNIIMGDYSSLHHSSEVNPRRIELLEQRFFSSKQTPSTAAAALHANNLTSLANSNNNLHHHQQQQLQHQHHQNNSNSNPNLSNPATSVARTQQLDGSIISDSVINQVNNSSQQQPNSNTSYHQQQQQQQHHLHHHHASMIVQQQQQQQLQVAQGHQHQQQVNQSSTQQQPSSQQTQQQPQQDSATPTNIVNNHTCNKISIDRSIQTELDMSKLKEQDTKSAAKDSKLEDLQQSKDDLDREMLTQQKLITKQKEQLAKCLDVTKQLLIDKSQLEKKAARQRCMQNRLRLGQFVTQRHGASFVENWVDGYAFTELMKKQEAVSHEKEEIDKQRKLLSKRRPSTSNSKPRIINSSNNNNSNSPSSSINSESINSVASGSSSLGFASKPSDASSNNSNQINSDHKSSSLMANGAEFAKPEIPKDFANRHRELDYYEQDEILKLRQTALRKEDAELQLEFEKLERERNLHIRELKRIHNEDQSRFNNHQILHDRYLLLTLLGKGGFCKYILLSLYETFKSYSLCID